MLTAEVHGPEVRGLALCPGRVVRYVFDARNEHFKPWIFSGSRRRAVSLWRDLTAI